MITDGDLASESCSPGPHTGPTTQDQGHSWTRISPTRADLRMCALKVFMFKYLKLNVRDDLQLE